MKNGTGIVVASIVLALVFGIVGGAGTAWYMISQQHGQVSGVQPPEQPPGADGGPRVSVITENDAIVQAVKRVDPAVVKIVATAMPQPSTPFEYFFGGPPQPRQGIGSGFIFNYDGRKLVLTNAHVVGGAQQIEVQTREGQKLDANLLRIDPATDVAVLEIEGGDRLPEAELGDSAALTIGEWVVAIGHPFAFDHTVTVGVVSAIGPRSPGPQAPERNMIQTDAAINSGNSGGPLVNLAGQVIGINSMIFSPTGTSLGIGFAIPINDVKEIVHFMMEGGPWVGVQTESNSTALARYLGLPTDQGAIVMHVVPNSPAQAAGIRQGDIILQVDGKKVPGAEELRDAVIAHEIGDTITMQIQRGSETLNIEVEAGRVPEEYWE